MDRAHDVDVLIAGAGLPGLALACALTSSGLSIALADRSRLDAPHEFDGWDTRVYAISPGSQAFLDSFGAWNALPQDRIQAVERMRVEGDASSLLTFSAFDLAERALAWIVEERELRRVLLARLGDCNVTTFAPAGFEHLAFSPQGVRLRLDGGTEIAARLVVGADGIRSWIRHAAGFVAEPKPYDQVAVVANFECERSHRAEARQWFLQDGGVLAWLPLPGRRISIVWSAPTVLADELMALAPRVLAERVADAGRHALGALVQITPPASFPLASLKLPAAVAHRLALVGDAAHGVHPLAGQGVNLGFGDAQALATILAERGPVADAGTPLLLERYARRRAEPVLAMHAVTDGLARLFGARSPWLARLRNLGMTAVDRLPPLKHVLAQPALR